MIEELISLLPSLRILIILFVLNTAEEVIFDDHTHQETRLEEELDYAKYDYLSF